jgi:hypothetical protein
VACAALATIGAHAQQQTTTQSQTSPQQQNQPSATTSHAVTFSGCVYEAADEPNVFAFQREPGVNGASSPAVSTTGSAAAGTATTTAGGGATATGTSGTTSTTTSGAASQTGTSGTPGTANSKAAGWYRLSSSAVQDLKQYAGRAVRISGTVVSPRDENGADLVIHDIGPNTITVTTVDLTPAPELKIQSVTPEQGSCKQQQNSTR